MADIVLVIDIFCSIIILVIGVGLLYSKNTRYLSTKILMVILGLSLVAYLIDALGVYIYGKE